MNRTIGNIVLYLLVITGILIACSSDDDGGPVEESPITFLNEIDFILTFGGTLNESAQSIKSTDDGGYIILGHAQSMDGDITDKQNESFDYWILKFDADDSLQWSKTYGGTGIDIGNDIIQTMDGGYAIIGYSTSADEDVTQNEGSHDFWIVKLDSTGNLSWQKSFGFSGIDDGITILQTDDNGYLVTGSLDVSASGGAGNSRNGNSRHAGGDYWAIKTNSSGSLEWSRYFGGNFTDTPFDVIETNSGYMLIGSSDSEDVDISNNKGAYDFWVVHISDSGDLTWEKSYGGQEIDEARAIAHSGDGNFIIVGDTRSNDQDITENKGGADLWAIKISPAGELLNQKTFGGTSFDVPRSVFKTTDNGFLISGSSRSSDGDTTSNQGQNDAWVLKIDANFNLEWQRSLGGTSVDFANDAVQLANGNVVAVGYTNSNDGDIISNQGFTDLLIIKLK